jgi:hypothetical protein
MTHSNPSKASAYVQQHLQQRQCCSIPPVITFVLTAMMKRWIVFSTSRVLQLGVFAVCSIQHCSVVLRRLARPLLLSAGLSQCHIRVAVFTFDAVTALKLGGLHHPTQTGCCCGIGCALLICDEPVFPWFDVLCRSLCPLSLSLDPQTGDCTHVIPKMWFTAIQRMHTVHTVQLV